MTLTAHQRAALGGRARELLNSSAFNEAVEAVDAYYRDSMFRTGPHEGETREQIFMEYNGLRRVIKQLQSWESDGEMASMELDAENKAKK